MARVKEFDLDALPRSAVEAATWLLKIADIVAGAGLANVSKRLTAVGKWANGIAMLDDQVIQLSDVADHDDPTPPRPAPASDDRPPNEAAVLEALAKYPDGAKLADLVDDTELPKSSVVSVLERLVKARKVVRTGKSRATRYGRVKERL